LPKTEFVTIRLYNILGSEVGTLVNGPESAGYKSVQFDGSRFGSGLYFYTIRAGSFNDTKKFMLIK
jgi:hypothetical protein